uniref:Uncharacterized protein n=1 Tax=Musca domestica TaxID=7370 RepID=T1PIQ3_MUSDO
MAQNWLHSSPYAPLPPKAVVGGYDSDGSPIYVGRSFHEGDCLPTKVIPSKRSAFVAWAGGEHPKAHYELLLGDGYSWQPCFGPNIPPDAISTGKTSSGEAVYVGRGHYANSLTVGKVLPSHGCLYIPYQGGEIKLEKYEVLVYGGGAPEAAPLIDLEDYKWVHSSAYSSLPPNAVVGGNDFDGDMMYVGRAFHHGDMLVLKVVPAKKLAFGSWRGEEVPKDHFEILCGRNLVWRHCYNHMIPDNAVVCGTTSLEQPVYIGRGHYEGSLTVGRISKVHKALFIPFRGVERRLETYEILVDEKQSAGWKVELASTDPLPSPPPPPPMTPEKVCPYPELKAPMPMPVPTPMGPPPPYTPMATPMPMPMPTPMPSYLPPKPGFTEATTYVPPAAGAYPPSQIIPASTYNPSNYPPPPPPATIVVTATTYQSLNRFDKWMPASPAYTPGDAVHAGQDSDMSTIYVCRAFHNGDFIPGKAIPGRSSAYISYQGQEIHKTNFEILVGQHYIWVPAIDGYAPGAVEGGRTSSGEILYIGRAHYHGSLTCGKIHRSHGCLYIPYGGREIRIDGGYEILVHREDYYRGGQYMGY